MNNKGLTLLEVAVIIVLIAVLAAVFLPPVCPGMINARRTACQSNLHQLYQLGSIHASTHPGEWPSLEDGGYWMSLTKTQPPLLQRDEFEVLLCPVNQEEWRGHSDYRSSRLPWRSLKPVDILGADKPGNHGPEEGGNALFKDGSLLELKSTDPRWKACDARLFP
jgi:type II secretory pathway pseudopilin PulG